MSDASDVSGLSAWIGEHLNSLKDLNQVLMLFIVMIMTASITEVASNTACANVLIPILISLVRIYHKFRIIAQFVDDKLNLIFIVPTT